MTFEEFKKAATEGRKSGNWWSGRFEVEGKVTDIKLFGTWMQIYRVDGLDYSNNMGALVSAFNRCLAKPFIH